MKLLVDTVKTHFEIILLVAAFITYMAFGDCIAECVAEYAGGY